MLRQDSIVIGCVMIDLAVLFILAVLPLSFQILRFSFFLDPPNGRLFPRDSNGFRDYLFIFLFGGRRIDMADIAYLEYPPYLAMGVLFGVKWMRNCRFLRSSFWSVGEAFLSSGRRETSFGMVGNLFTLMYLHFSRTVNVDNKFTLVICTIIHTVYYLHTCVFKLCD